MEPPAGLVGWWPLDETSGTTATDIISGNDGTYVGDPTPVTGNVAGALSFDGIDDEIFVPSTFPFHQPDDATLEFWLNTPATGHQSVFWTRADAEDGNRFHIYINEDSTFGFDYRSPSGELPSLAEAVSIPRNTWTHLAITRTGNVYNLCVNGVLSASATDPSPDLPTAADWQIAGQGQIDFMYNGSLDEISLYNRALSAEEIAAIHTAGSAGKCKDSGAGQLVYTNDFEDPADPLVEWSTQATDTTPEGDRRFLGQVASETVELTLTDLPPHTNVTVSFDLYIINSWDGNFGPDLWEFSVTGGPTLLHTTFGPLTLKHPKPTRITTPRAIIPRGRGQQR